MTAIVSGDILMKYSTTAGSAGNTTTSNAAGSLGKYISTTTWPGGTSGDIIRNITGGENAGSTAQYKCVFIHNNNASNTYQNTVVYISSETAGGASASLAVDSTAASAIGSATAQALTATTETAPGGSVTGLSYSSPTTAATGLSVGDIAVGNCRAIWLKATPANTAALSADGFVLTVAGDTGSL